MAMSPQLIVRPLSKTSSIISPEDDIPPQPLDQHANEPHHQNGLGLALSHDRPNTTDSPLQSPDTIRPPPDDRKAVAFHKLPSEVLER
jgi:hypothetical protein